MSEQDKDGENKPLKVVFMEGCFDNFDGTQEELDELVAHITELAASGKILEQSRAVEDLDDEILDILPLLTTGNTRQ
jgi:hypothetical protein